MCSVLLIFLVFVIIFDIAKDSVPNWISAQTFPKRTLRGATCLVSASNRSSPIGQQWPLQPGEEVIQTPFERSTVFETHPKARQDDTRTLALEVFQLHEDQQKDSSGMCPLPIPLVNGCSPSHPTPSRAKMGIMGSGGNHMESIEGTIPIAIEIIQSEKPHNWERRERQSQNQGQEDQERRGQAHSGGKASDFPLCTFGSGHAALAQSGSGDLQPYPISSDSTDWSSKSGGGQHAQKCVLGDQPHATRCERVCGTIGKGDSEDCHQDTPFCHYRNGESAKAIGRNISCQETAQSALDSPHHRSHRDMAITATRLPQTSEQSPRDCEQGQSRHRATQSQHTTADHNSARCFLCCSAVDASGHRSRGFGCRQHGGETAAPAAISAQIMRRVTRSGIASTERGTGYHGRSDKGRGRRGQRQKATSLFRALWGITTSWYATRCQNAVTQGGAVPVLSNGSHDAVTSAGLADAYVLPPGACAACHSLPQDPTILLHWRHSVQFEPNFQDNFAAVLGAWKNRWQVLCEEFHEGLSHAPVLTANPSPSDDSVHNSRLFCPDQIASHDAAPMLYSELRSCFRSAHQHKSIGDPPTVHFCSEVSVHIGLDNNLHMASVPFGIDDLKTWKDKPWHKKSKKSKTLHAKLPKHDQCRTTDEYYNVPSRWFQQEEEVHEHEQNDPEDANHFLHEAPEALQYLFDALQEEGLVTGPRIHDGVFIRTWLVHHVHTPQCFHPRMIEINGHWRFWHAEIIGAWRDQTYPNELIIYDIVRPNPPRSVNIRQEVLFDLIVSQGLDAPRRAGLVTILQRDDPAGRAAFSVGVSLSERTSGHQIVQSAESLHECNLHLCRIRHGREQIPFTMEPVHDMQDGDSFTVAISTQNTNANAGTDVPIEQHQQNSTEHHDHDMRFDEESIDPSPSLASTNDLLAGVHIHRLGHIQRHGRLRWDTVAHALIDAAAVVNMPPADFVGFHHLQVDPDDQHEDSYSIILQHVLDIAPGSTEKLVLVDVEMHDPARTQAMPKAPAVSRRVYKVVPTLVRQHILIPTHTAAYCEWHDQDCIVFRNHVIWPKQDIGPSQIEHGMYFRVIVPPPPSPHWEISRTIQAFHDAVACFDCPEAYQVAIESLEAPVAHREGTATTAAQDVANDQANLHSPTPHQSKSTELEGDIDVPIMLAPHVRMRRLRPEHDGSEEWLLELGQIFSDHAETETIEGDAFLYILTWYIDHQRHTSCRSPRPLRLDSAAIAWLEEFRHVWRDHMNRRVPFSVFVVRPRPPQSRLQNYACHVIIEQNRQPGLSAGVLTALFAGPNRDAIMQGAFSTPRFIRKQDLIDVMQVNQFCTGRRCTAYHNQEPVHLVVATEVVSGFSIRLHIDPPRDQLPLSPTLRPEHFDDLIFMQLGPANTAPTGAAVNLPGPEAECAPYQLDAQAAVFQPGQIFIGGQSEFVQDLYSQWTQIAFSWEEEAMSTDVITWFVDHREGFARCLQSRTVRLYSDYFEWENLIKAAWRDLVVDGLPLEYHFVLPHPPRLEHNTVGHVIVIQAPHESRISSLVTVFDSFIGSSPNDIMRLVITTEEHVRFEHVTHACGYGNHFNENIPCQVWIDEHHLPLGIFWPGRSGHNIVLQVYRQVMLLPVARHVARGLNMLQISARKKISESSKQVLSLDALIPATDHPLALVPVILKQLVFDPCLPRELFLPDGYGMDDVEKELDRFGHQIHAYELTGVEQVLVVPIAWKPQEDINHYIYCQLSDQTGTECAVILHQTHETFNDLQHMQFLHQHDFLRAVIVSVRALRKGLLQVIFRNNNPKLEDLQKTPRVCSPWPDPLKVVQPTKVFMPEQLSTVKPAHCLALGISHDDLTAFFESSTGVLCPWYQHLDLPSEVMQGICDTATIEGDVPDLMTFDRLVIYTDGSSKPCERRKPPLQVADTGTS